MPLTRCFDFRLTDNVAEKDQKLWISHTFVSDLSLHMALYCIKTFLMDHPKEVCMACVSCSCGWARGMARFTAASWY